MAIIEIFISISSHIALSLITSWCFKQQQQQQTKKMKFLKNKYFAAMVYENMNEIVPLPQNITLKRKKRISWIKKDNENKYAHFNLQLLLHFKIWFMTQRLYAYILYNVHTRCIHFAYMHDSVMTKNILFVMTVNTS